MKDDKNKKGQRKENARNMKGNERKWRVMKGKKRQMMGNMTRNSARHKFLPLNFIKWHSLSLSLSPSLPPSLPPSLVLCLYIYLSVCLSVYLSIHLSVYPSIYLSVNRSIHPSIYLSLDRSIHRLSISFFFVKSVYLYAYFVFLSDDPTADLSTFLSLSLPLSLISSHLI